MHAHTRALVLLALLFTAACGTRGAPAPAPERAETGNPVDGVEISRPVELVFWHRQVGASEELQQQLIDEFMAAHPNIRVKAETVGDYNKLYEKTIAAIQAGAPPDLVAAYENQAAEYYEADALVPFDDYIHSARYGLTPSELADYIPSYLEATRFPQYGGKSLTFPYTKSDLVMFTNLEVLRSLGFEKPAATWDEFLTHCRAAVAAGRQCWALAVDPSAFSAIVYGYGGELVTPDGKRSRFDEPPVLRALQLYETVAREKLAYQIQGFDDQNDLLSGKAMYMIRSSTGVPRLAAGFGDDRKWEVSIIPQGGVGAPTTILYGANISILKTTPERQLAAWLFIKYLTRPDVTARWGLDPSNGYFPVRQSTLQEPSAIAYLESNPRFRQALEVSRAGRVEPSVRGWAEVRSIVADAITGIITGRLTAAQAQQQLTERANRALAQP